MIFFFKYFDLLKSFYYKKTLFGASAHICDSYFKIYIYILVYSTFLFFSPQLGDWMYEKMLMARDSSRDETQKLHKKWQKHQAFMAELAQNKEWLDKIEKVSAAAGRSAHALLVPCRYISLTWSFNGSFQLQSVFSVSH